jgi:hypothetical protein
VSQAFVPADLLAFLGIDPVERPGLARQLVAACVFGGGGKAGEWNTVEALRRGNDVWPAGLLRRPVRAGSTLSILLELERLDVVRVVDHCGNGFLAEALP